MDSELEETPNGETLWSHMGPPEEMKTNHTQGEPTSAKSFHGMSLQDLFIIEICAGSARLSKVAHQCGFRTMAVDHSTARSCGFPICVFDLTDPDDLERMVQFIEESADSILGIWMAPSCGTCSRAREKRLVSLERAGVKTPIPLRSLATGSTGWIDRVRQN